MTGPGLPDEGVPLDNPAGAAGSGSMVEVKNDTKWKFTWNTDTLRNTNVQTARYTIYAVDLNYPAVTAKSSVMIRKPVLSASADPNPVGKGDFVTIRGSCSLPVDHVRMTVVRVPELQERSRIEFDVPMSGDGTFSKQFHTDLPEGTYTVTINTPANELSTTFPLSIGIAAATTPVAQQTTAVSTTQATPVPSTVITTVATPSITATAAPPTPTEGLPMTGYLLYGAVIVVVLVVIVGIVLFLRSRPSEEEEEEGEETEESEQ
jgi:hypothetical protein